MGYNPPPSSGLPDNIVVEDGATGRVVFTDDGSVMMELAGNTAYVLVDAATAIPVIGGDGAQVNGSVTASDYLGPGGGTARMGEGVEFGSGTGPEIETPDEMAVYRIGVDNDGSVTTTEV